MNILTKLKAIAILLMIMCVSLGFRVIYLEHHIGKHCYIIAHDNRPSQTRTAFDFGFICGWYTMGVRRGDLFDPPTDLMGKMYPICQEVVTLSNKRVETARSLVDRLQSLKEKEVK